MDKLKESGPEIVTFYASHQNLSNSSHGLERKESDPLDTYEDGGETHKL